MALTTVQNILDDVRSNLNDNLLVPTGELFPNSVLLPLFGEPYRSMFARLMGPSKQVQKDIYLILPIETSVLIPSTMGVTDFNAPVMIEERPPADSIAITSTDTSTPINVTTTNPHNLGPNGTIAQGAIGGVLNTFAPWGNWFVTVTGTSTFSLNGSGSDGIAGSGGSFYPENQQTWTEVYPLDLPAAGLDGQPGQVLGNYIWQNSQLLFRGATTPIQLRITYRASGAPPTNPNYTIPIDNCRDFLAAATTANAARSKSWFTQYEVWRNQAYGDPTHPDEPSLLDLFFAGQVLSAQNGPPRRQMPFRDKRFRYGSYMLG